jgi:hypothetical protein
LLVVNVEEEPSLCFLLKLTSAIAKADKVLVTKEIKAIKAIKAIKTKATKIKVIKTKEIRTKEIKEEYAR